MPKLCEIIAIVSGRKTETQKKLTEAHQLTQKPTLFAGATKTYQPRDADDPETLPTEKVEIQLRAQDVVLDIEKPLVNLYDLIVTQDTGNTKATADIVLEGGKVLVSNVPVTTLLYLEKQTEDLKKFYSSLPLLDPSKKWEKDEGNRCSRTETTRTRTKKINTPVILYPATDKHPAQVQLIQEDKIIGDYVTVEFSGAITKRLQEKLLGRVSALKDAIVLAREKANSTSIEQVKIGEAIFGYLHADL